MFRVGQGTKGQGDRSLTHFDKTTTKETILNQVRHLSLAPHNIKLSATPGSSVVLYLYTLVPSNLQKTQISYRLTPSHHYLA